MQKMEELGLHLKSNKKEIRNKLKDREKTKILDTKEQKSKLKYYLENVENFEVGKRKKYMEILSRKEVQLIFKARGRMIPTKCNYKGKYKNNLKCRFCGIHDESQNHILEECNQINRDEIEEIKTEDIFEDVSKLKETAKKLEKIEEILRKCR